MKPQPITANKRNCLTKLYLDRKVIGVGSIRLFANRYAQAEKRQRHCKLSMEY